MEKRRIYNQNNKLLIENKYTPLLLEALNNIDSSYYRLETTYGDIVRERVFCYEFYHQLRLLESKYSPIKLHPEIDKRGHKKFEEKDQRNPDFIFHIPGKMSENQIVIEVKGDVNSNIFKDFETLDTFCQNYRYKIGYFILFGNSRDKLINFLKKKEENVEKVVKYANANHIIIICKKNQHSQTDIITLSSLIKNINKLDM